MANFEETVIKNFSGLSTEIKPTIAAGNNIPNGSRWREVDTNKVYFFNLESDKWYDTKDQVETTPNDIDYSLYSFLNNITKELKIMNLHLSILTDNQINKTEVE